jgi:hypothetical protein
MAKTGGSFFFGETADRDKAFPGIKSFSLIVKQDPFGFHSRGAPVERRYTKANVPRFERCVNPRCQQGGLDLQNVVLWPPKEEARFSCTGHEGSPKGRRKGRSCDNTFIVSIVIEKEAS